jgi:glycosyltransferase involved in cell wall biosynthesis
MSISVIIPVYNSADNLRACLEHLSKSTRAPLECIVVDDHSTDDSAEVARQFGAEVISIAERSGPAHARNVGALAARGDILYFVDADVCVYPSTVARISSAFADDPDLDALIGSYDDNPASPDFLSQYRNLMHCYVHQTSRSEACTFWSGCGAIRRPLFLEHSGFDESYRRPAIEDIELGYRLRRARCKILLDRQLVVKHRKRWTFWNLVKTDVLDRGIPWTELILRDGVMPNDLNVQLSHRVSVALTFLLLIVTGIAAYAFGGYFLTPLLSMLFFLLVRYWVEPSPQTASKGILSCFAVTVCALVFFSYHYRMFVLIPLIITGVLPLLLRHRYASASPTAQRVSSLIVGGYVLLAVGLSLNYLPHHPVILFFLVILSVLVAVNNQFYLFLAAKQGRLSALAALPFHLLYHCYNGISFGVGLSRHALRVSRSPKRKVAINASGD